VNRTQQVFFCVLFIIIVTVGLIIAKNGKAPDVYRKDLCPEIGYMISGNSLRGFECVFNHDLYEYEIGQINNPPRKIEVRS